MKKTSSIRRKLGKLPARPDAVKFKLEKYIDTTSLPTPPIRFGHHVLTPGMYGNDKYGDCVFAGGANIVRTWHSASGKSPAPFTEKSVLSDYSALTGFDPRNPDETDNGTDMSEMASYWRKTGLWDGRTRHKIDAYVALRPGDFNQLMLACYLFEAVGVGVMFPDAAFDQFDAQKPWSVVPSQVGGGHYIGTVIRNSKGRGCCYTWGRLQAYDPDWYVKYNDESLAYLSFDALNTKMLTAEGFDLDTLRRDLKAL